MPSEWTTAKISDVASINDVSISRDYPYDVIRYVDVSSVAEGHIIDEQAMPLADAPSRARRIVRDQDTIISTVRPNLRHYAFLKQPQENTVVSTGFAVLSAKRVEPRFLYYYVTTDVFTEYLTRIAEGHTSAYPAINPDVIGNAEIPLPPLPEQRAIASVLGALDDKIELNARMNRTLEEMARAIFKSWFVDFDPVRAKMEGRRPSGMDDSTAALFPDSFEDSALGPIPKGWSVLPMTEVFEINPARNLRRGQMALYVQMSNMPTAGPRVLDSEMKQFTSGMRFANGDTLIARITPCLENGKTAYVDFLGEGEVGWGSTEYIVIRSRPPFPPEYSYLLARTPEFRAHAIQSMTGSSGRQRVSVSALNSYQVVIPETGVLEAFGRNTSCTMKTIGALSNESDTLAQIRDALLPKLISGEIRVNHVENVDEAIA